MQDGAAQRRLLGEGLQLSHQVVLDLGFDRQRPRQIHRLHVAAQVGDLFGRHQAVFGLHFGQRHP